MTTEGVTCFTTFEGNWVTDFGEVGRTELLTGDVYVGDLGERGWVTFNWDTGCLTELWETGDWMPLGAEFETMLLFATCGFSTIFCFYCFLSTFTSKISLLSANFWLEFGWYL